MVQSCHTCKSVCPSTPSNAHVDVWDGTCDTTILRPAARDILMIHVESEWIVSEINDSCHTWMSHAILQYWDLQHVTYQRFTSNLIESCQSCEWVTSQMNESCHMYEWVMSHVWISHRYRAYSVTRVVQGQAGNVNESCHSCEWVMPHMWMSHVTHMNESCHTYEWDMSHRWMSHVTRMKKS